jgi:hypothetical protein
MVTEIPRVLAEAIRDGSWHDPGPDALRALLYSVRDLPELELFEDSDIMSSVWAQIDVGGYVEDPECCMVRNTTSVSDAGDVRLVFEKAIFVGGSTVPGDDVFLALDLRSDADHPTMYIFDWNRPVPDRWVAWGRLSSFLEKLESR